MQPIYFFDPYNFYCYPHFPPLHPINTYSNLLLQLPQQTLVPPTAPQPTPLRLNTDPNIHKHPKVKAPKGSRKNQNDNLPLLNNRNILPNMSNVVLSYLRRVNKSGHEVLKALEIIFGDDQELNHEKMKKFYAYQNYLKTNVNDYIIRDAIKVVMKHCDPQCAVFTLEEQTVFNAVFRRVARKYLQQQYLLNILNGQMEHVKMKDHLKVRRFLLNLLRGS